MSNFYITPTTDKAPVTMRERKYAKAPKAQPVSGVALPNRMNWIERETYVPPPSASVRPGADDFKRYPSRYGTQSVYHDRGHA